MLPPAPASTWYRQPEWVPATLLVYGPPMQRRCSVVFEDEGEPFRHAIDLQGARACGGGAVRCGRRGLRWRRRPAHSVNPRSFPAPCLQNSLLPLDEATPESQRTL